MILRYLIMEAICKASIPQAVVLKSAYITGDSRNVV